MRINKISNTIQRWATNISKNEKMYDKINNKIFPIGETTVATGFYSLFIQKNKKIEKERKPALHYQNIICGVAGILLANKVNKSIQKHQTNIIKILEQNKSIKNPAGLVNGLKIAMPVIIFTSIVRFFIPVISTPISSKITEIQDKKKLNKVA